tara:strand:- start:18 stop:152 length:135 start_codon:yes stop_codon:yes gene_type:complete
LVGAAVARTLVQPLLRVTVGAAVAATMFLRQAEPAHKAKEMTAV